MCGHGLGLQHIHDLDALVVCQPLIDLNLIGWADVHGKIGENFYFKEIIRRFPHTVIAKKAWVALNEEVHMGYTGSQGDFTPPSIKRALKQLEKLSEPKKKGSQKVKHSKK